MLLSIATTRPPATDLGWLLAKHPDRAQAFDLSFGVAHVVWPEASDARAELAMLLDVDPVGLVRGKPGAQDGPLAAYVNDRPYVASSFTSVAISQVFGSALNGRCKAHPELTDQTFPLTLRLAAVPSRGGRRLLDDLFSPLGWRVEATRLPRDETVPAWGDSALYVVTLTGETTVKDALRHLYVLLPVLDDDKHYWVGDDEVDKLVEKGEGWLGDHPHRDLVARRYLKHRGGLARAALRQLVDDAEEAETRAEDPAEDELEKPLRLNELRMQAVVSALEEVRPTRVVDLGCGEGRLLARLATWRALDEIVGTDVSVRSLEVAERRLERVPDWRSRVRLLQSSVTYRDPRIDGFDAATLIEVIEHVDEERLPALEACVFGHARPRTVIVTTPNAEYNALYEVSGFRHADHRFEWTRAQFAAWADRVAAEHGYAVAIRPVGPVDDTLGSPTQMGVFTWAP